MPGITFYIGLFKRKHKIIFLSEKTRPSVVASSSRPLPSYTIYVPGPENGPCTRGHFLHRLIKGKHEHRCLNPHGLDRALTFGMLHHVVDFYQVCLNSGPGPKMATHRLSCFTSMAYVGKT